MKSEEKRWADLHGGQRAEIENQILENKERIKHIEENLQVTNSDIIQFNSQIIKLNERKDGLQSKGRYKQEEISQIESKIRSLESHDSQYMSVFGPNIHRLLKAIRNDTGFKDQPIGPIGMHIRLKRPEWSPILETFFGGTLDAFAVTNKDDQRRLQNIILSQKW